MVRWCQHSYGLLRCGRGCRLRWMNYLRDDLKRGYFTPEEEETIFNLHDAFGNSWALIAAYFPGRSDNEIKNLWNYHLSRRVRHVFQDDGTFKTVLLRNLDHDNSKEKEEPPANRDKYKKKVEPPANGDMNKKKEEPPAKVSYANSSTAGEELIGLPADLVEWFDPREIAMMNDGLNEFGNLNEGESSESMEVAVEKMLWDLEPVELYPEPVHTDAPLDDTAVNMDSGIVQGNNEVTDAPLGDTAVNMESGIGQGNNEGTDATLGDTAVKMADSGTAQCNNEVTDASLGDTFVNMDSAIAQGNNDVTDTSVADITAFLERELGDHYEQLLESFCLVYETYVACL